LTPGFFGSAVNNFGVQMLLDAFLDLAPAPQPHAANGKVIQPTHDGFSGFIFEMQANMAPHHRASFHVATSDEQEMSRPLNDFPADDHLTWAAKTFLTASR
jgi:peptide subunit release factor RF-3